MRRISSVIPFATIVIRFATIVSVVGCGADGEVDLGGDRPSAEPAPAPFNDRSAPPLLLDGSATTARARLDDAMARNGINSVVIMLDAIEPLSIDEAQNEVIAVAGAELRVRRRYESVPGLAGELTVAGYQQLQTHSTVSSIRLDERVEGGLVESVPLVGADVTRTSFGVTGAGVRVAVLDTGVDYQHPDLADDFVDGHCFTDQACPPFGTDEGSIARDDEGHGTHVTGIITSAGTVAPPGFAPDAEYVAVKVLDSNNSGPVSDAIAGLNWVLTNLPTLRVDLVNMSLGAKPLYSGTCDAAWPAYAYVVEQLHLAGGKRSAIRAAAPRPEMA